MSSARTTTRNRVSVPSSVGRPPRSRMLQQPSQLRARLAEPGAGTLQVFLLHAGRAEVALHAAVAALELSEDAEHRSWRCLGDPAEPFELLLGLGRHEPAFVPRQQALLAERVVGGDVLVRDACEMEEERGQKAGAVLPADAMDDEAALRRPGDGANRCADVGLEALEEDQVDVARRRLDVGRRRRGGLDLGTDLLPLALVRLHERDVLHVDLELARRVVLALVVAAQVDHCADAVLDERGPAGLGQLADAVGANDRAEARLAAVSGRMAAEVADVQAAVPNEVAATLQLGLARRLAGSSRLRAGSRPGRAPPARPYRRS